MATNTYVALKTTTVTGSSAASITLDNIPQGYTDLVLVAGNMQTTSDSYIYLQFNSDTTNDNYSRTSVLGDGSSASSGRTNSSNSIAQRFLGYARSASNTPSQLNINIQNYSNTTTYKTYLTRSTSTNVAVIATIGLWRSTAAINQIVLTPNAGSFSIGSTFTLYGIAAAAPATAKATGGTITYAADGYVYHTFTSGTASFTPTQALSCEILMIGGGGGGMKGKTATYAGSGGGAGQVSNYSAVAFSSGVSHTVSVGGGGSAAGSLDTNGTTGTSTTITGSGFTTLTAAGGEGGLYNTGAGGTSGNGYAGGSATGGDSSGGGGGGATAVGGIWSLGNGGAGTSVYSQWGLATSTGDNVSGTVWFGSGGNGQGGTLTTTKVPGGGGYRNSNKNGLSNTGGGGAGGNDGAGSGGSGLVIIRYAN